MNKIKNFQLQQDSDQSDLNRGHQEADIFYHYHDDNQELRPDHFIITPQTSIPDNTSSSLHYIDER